MNVITLISLLVLMLQICILATGAVIGFRRGLGRTSVRIISLSLCAAVAFFLGKFIAGKLSAVIMKFVGSYEQVQILLDNSAELAAILQQLIGALLVPFVFAVLFGLFQLISLIRFKKISNSIVSFFVKNEKSHRYNYAGAAVGLVAAYFVAAFLLSPFSMLFGIVEQLDGESVAAIYEITTGKEMPENLSLEIRRKNSVRPILAIDVGYKVTSLATTQKTHMFYMGVRHFGWTNNLLTLGNTPNGTTFVASDEAANIINTAGSTIYTYKSSDKNGDGTLQSIANAGNVFTQCITNSEFLTELAGYAVGAVGSAMQDGNSESTSSSESNNGDDDNSTGNSDSSNSFSNLLPTFENEGLNAIINACTEIMADTTPDNVSENLTSIFGDADAVSDENTTEYVKNLQSNGEEKETSSASVSSVTSVITSSTYSTVTTSTPSQPTATSSATTPETSTASTQTTTSQAPTVQTATSSAQAPATTSAKTPTSENSDTSSKGNVGILGALAKVDLSNPENIMNDEDAANALAGAVSNMAQNKNMTKLFESVRSYALSLINNSGFNIFSENYKDVYYDVCARLNALANTSKNLSFDEQVACVEDAIQAAADAHDFKITSMQKNVVAICIVQEFFGEYYRNDNGQIDVKVLDLMYFFGINDIPEWAFE